MKIKKTAEGWELIPQTNDEESRLAPLVQSLASANVFSGYVVDVNDGDAGVMLNAPLDENNRPDMARYTNEHDGDYPECITLAAEQWMQTGTRLVIAVCRHFEDEPEIQVRASASALHP